MDALYEQLKDRIRELKRVVVAFSGGVDSTLLLAAAHDALGDLALGVTAVSATYPDHEHERACELAKLLGARHQVIETDELSDPTFRANPPDRCYHCKRELFDELFALAAAEGNAVVLDGSNVDDFDDYRPGRQAAKEVGVRSPLAELGLGKAEVRRLAKERGLPNWSEPACACLASRIPYGEQITAERLGRIGAAEASLRSLGFRVLRVRDHGSLARIEVGADELDRALEPKLREQIVRAIAGHGYAYVCLDLKGYRTGAMNETLESRPRG
ncbi:MAG TPA: ATP-dependent sacrificial sulfur transferase LarE [Myxococcales bacterium]|jgi:uncharacterized protein|nr:ATP-dependent sacrificial sulfur transferase LarE [Myxococcales bacterium]